MHFRYILPALFAASGLAAKFEGFDNYSCQNKKGVYTRVTEKQLEDIVVQEFPTTPVEKNLSRQFPYCPSNKDDTFRSIQVPQWEGGVVVAVYYEDTDTYLACTYVGTAQSHGYAGFCKKDGAQ